MFRMVARFDARPYRVVNLNVFLNLIKSAIEAIELHFNLPVKFANADSNARLMITILTDYLALLSGFLERSQRRMEM